MSRTELRPTDVALPVNLLVALDGSLFSERAITPARRLADVLGAGVHLWSAVRSPDEADDRRGRLRELGEANGALWEVHVTDRPVDAIPEAGDGDRDRLVCLATHGRDRSAGLAHSVSAAVLAASDGPVLLVGPRVPQGAPPGSWLAVCVDGSKDSEAIVPVAVAWAAALSLSVTILTVAEPVPESVRHPGSYPRLHGPRGDADAYVDGLAADWGATVPVSGRVIYDPVDVDGALLDAFAPEPPDLVVMGTRAPRGLRRLIFGSTAAAVAHGAPAPVLVVPI